MHGRDDKKTFDTERQTYGIALHHKDTSVSVQPRYPNGFKQLLKFIGNLTEGDKQTVLLLKKFCRVNIISGVFKIQQWMSS